MSWFEGGAVVITGAGSGIGRAAAKAFAEAGCDIVAADIEHESAEETALAIRQMGRRSSAYRLNVSDGSQVAAFADRVSAEWDRIDILINNAGVSLRPFRSVWEASEADWRWVMDVNFWGVLHGIRAFVPKMLAQRGRKHIVNTSSVAPWLSIGGHGPYTASKAAIDGLSASLRSELIGTNIGLTILVPGHVETNLPKSERLRPAADRSDQREVTPFVPIEDPAQEARDEAPHIKAGRRPFGAAFETIAPDTVGGMLVDAVRENRPYCVTQPFRKEDVERLTSHLTALT